MSFKDEHPALYKIFLFLVGALIVIGITLLIVYFIRHANQEDGGRGVIPSGHYPDPCLDSSVTCDTTKKSLDYLTFVANANKYGKKLPLKKFDQIKNRYMIINNNCDEDMILSDIAYDSSQASARTLNFFTDQKNLTDSSKSLTSATGGTYLPAKTVMQAQGLNPLSSGRVWPRTGCSLCKMPVGVQTNYCEGLPAGSAEHKAHCPAKATFLTSAPAQVPDQAGIQKMFGVDPDMNCPDPHASLNAPLFVKCETGDVPLQCGRTEDCAYLGNIDTNYYGNAGFGLGAMGKSGRAPSILAEYTLQTENENGKESDDYYDMSQVDGYSMVPMAFGPIPDRTLCSMSDKMPYEFNAKPSACIQHCQNHCPPELQDIRDDKFVGCLSICQAVMDEDHKNRYRERNQKCKGLTKPEETILDKLSKETLYWDESIDMSAVRPAPTDDVWHGTWQGQEWKTKGRWMPDLDGSKCGVRDPSQWNDTQAAAQYAAIEAKGNATGHECKFMADLICCSGGMKNGNTDCLTPPQVAQGANLSDNTSQFGCSPYNLSSGPHKDYYQKRTCWDSDWPPLSKAWCDKEGIPDKYCSYAHIFKMDCPDAYSWQFDDLHSTYQANKGDYYVEFCPATVDASSPNAKLSSVSQYCQPHPMAPAPPGPPPPPKVRTQAEACAGQKGTWCSGLKGTSCCDTTSGTQCDHTANSYCCPCFENDDEVTPSSRCQCITIPP